MDHVIVQAKLDTLRYRGERVEACIPDQYEDLIENPDAETGRIASTRSRASGFANHRTGRFMKPCSRWPGNTLTSGCKEPGITDCASPTSGHPAA